MKLKFSAVLLLAASLFSASSTQAQSARDYSLKQELELAISRGLEFLKKQQTTEGYWSTADEPAISALVLSAAMADPNRNPSDPTPAHIEKGYQFLLSNAKPDGGIYSKGRANYNTSLALLALTFNNKPEYQQTILAARKFVIGQQNDFDEKGQTDNPFDGGIGYGKPGPNTPPHADLSNTHFALEALHYSKKIFEDQANPEDKKNDLNWAAAIKFVERCQNRTASNDQPWASDDAKNAGGFVYEPGTTKSEEDKLPDGRIALRSYGSISYAGMLSFIYAGLTPDDERVQAALKWLSENYTLDENPGMEQEGKFYYYHTMAKALSVAGINSLKTAEGKEINWRDQLSRHLLNVQKSDGSWINDGAGRWMENDPVLVTSYVLLALEHIHRTL